jgi:RHS repeat-associated protein
VLRQATTVVDTLIDPYTRCWIEDHNLFAGMWRDEESGTDHTLHRQFASYLARWLSPDPAGKASLIYGAIKASRARLSLS